MNMLRKALGRMKGKKSRFWLRRKLFWKKEMLLPAAFLVFALACWGIAAERGMVLAVEMSRPVQLRGTLTADNGNELFSSMDDIRAFSRYEEQMGTLSLQEYSAPVTVIRLEYDYLLYRYGDAAELSWSESMPYVMVSGQALEAMRTGSLEHLDLTDSQKYVGEIFSLTYDEENSAEVRIWGILPDERNADGNRILAAGDFVSSEEGQAASGTAEGQSGGEETAYIYTVLPETGALPGESMYMLDVLSGFRLDSVLKTLEENGFSVISGEPEEVQGMLEQWQEDGRMVIILLIMGSLGLVCGVMILFYQRKLWILEHREFLQYLEQF